LPSQSIESWPTESTTRNSDILGEDLAYAAEQYKASSYRAMPLSSHGQPNLETGLPQPISNPQAKATGDDESMTYFQRHSELTNHPLTIGRMIATFVSYDID